MQKCQLRIVYYFKWKYGYWNTAFVLLPRWFAVRSLAVPDKLIDLNQMFCLQAETARKLNPLSSANDKVGNQK